MRYGSYDEVSSLSISEQRRVLLEGDAVERIWAGWSLGLALGVDSLDLIVKSARESPSPGTRRHLLVILAGFRAVAAIRFLAGSDPDEYVRATACRYLIRLTPPDTFQSDRSILACFVLDSSPLVREASMEEIS